MIWIIKYLDISIQVKIILFSKKKCTVSDLAQTPTNNIILVLWRIVNFDLMYDQ